MTLLRLLVLLPALWLAACSSVWQGTGDTLKAALAGKPDAPAPSREQVLATPYFQMLATTPAASTVMLLTRVAGPTHYWQAGTQESLVITHGLVQRTTGLVAVAGAKFANLQQTTFIGPNPFAAGLHRLADNTTAVRELDLDGYRHGIRVASTFRIHGPETLTLLDESLALVRIDEDVSSPAIGLAATNHYWVDKQGLVWKSTQTLWPGLTLTLTQLRPYLQSSADLQDSASDEATP